MNKRIVAVLVTGLATAITVLGVPFETTAAADPVSRTAQYTCSFPWIGNQPVRIKIDANIARQATVGKPTPKFAVNAAATVDAASTEALRLAGIKTVEGTVDAKAAVAAPQGGINVALPFNVPRTSLPGSGPVTVRATGTAPALTFNRPGAAKITVGDITMRLTPIDANGKVTFPGKFSAPCKLDSGQNNVLASFTITEARTPSEPVTARPVQSTTPQNSSTANITTAQATTPSSVPSTPTASPPTSLTSSRQSGGDPLWPVVGILTTGVLAAAVAILLWRRRLTRRS